jgi:excinuclease ABC subunit C
LTELQLNLRLLKIPRHIECFDNSNLQGSNAVAAMVCFKDGIPSKNDYRRFKIKTVVGIDDFSSMKEIVYRRYYRVLKESEALPDLIIIDGGKGQLNAALESIDELGIRGKVTLVGLAKNKEEIFFANDKESILLDWNSDILKLIRRIRDEVHRFGITFHRNTRSNNAIKNELESIPGIGTSTADLLLKKFKSVKKIKATAENELIELVGKSKTELIKKYLK